MLNFTRKDPVSAVIIGLSLLVCCIGLVVSETLEINVSANDYYQYIELGNNIFNDFNFTVTHQTGETVALSPLFPILVKALSSPAGDPIRALRWLIVFSMAFSIVPIFLLTRSAFNQSIGLLSSLLFISALGFYGPLYEISAHVFIILPASAACWLVWKTLHEGSPKRSQLILCGLMLSLAALTRGWATIYLGVIALFFFYSDIRSSRFILNKTLKKIAYVLLGFLPLVLMHTAIIGHAARKTHLYSNATRTFITGNHRLSEELSIKNKIYRLNDAGDEFASLEEMEETRLLAFFIAHPGFMARKYLTLLIDTAKTIRLIFSPFLTTTTLRVIASLVMLILPWFAFSRSRSFSALYISSWLSPLLCMPLIRSKTVYIRPFIPFMAILLVAGGYHLYVSLGRKKLLRIIFLLAFSFLISRAVLREVSMSKDIEPIDEYRRAASWVMQDAAGSGGRQKIMARKTVFSHLTGCEYIALPYEDDWERVKNFSLLKNVDYIITDNGNSFHLLASTPAIEGLPCVYQDDTGRNSIKIYRPRAALPPVSS